MLYYQFQNYDGFKHLFGSVNRSNGTCGRKNKILLAYIKDKRVLHEAAANNQYDPPPVGHSRDGEDCRTGDF